MKLIVMRHGEAEASSFSDEARNLTVNGKHQVQKASRWLADHVVENKNINVAWVSPFERAQQTFDGVFSQLEIGLKTDVDELTPDAKPREIHQRLDRFLYDNPGTQNMILISHMPLLCYLLDELLLHHQGNLFETSSMAIIDYDVSACVGELIAFYHPSISD